MSEIQVSVEDLGQLQRLLHINIPNYPLEQNIEHRLRDVGKTVSEKGFRPGKVPLSYLRKLYGEEVRQEVLNKAIEETLSKSLFEQGLEAAYVSQITEVEASSEVGLKYTASLEIYPSFNAPNLADISLEKPQVDITEADVSKVLDELRHQHADWVEVQRPAQWGDKVMFDLIPTEGALREDLVVVLKKERLPQGFDKLVGCDVGASITVPAPDAVEVQSSSTVTLTVKNIKEPKLPEINGEFAKRLDIEEGVEALYSQLRQYMQEGLDNRIHEKLKAQLIKKLLEIYTFEALPQGLLQEEFKRLESEWRHDKQQAMAEEDTTKEVLSEETKETLESTAKRRVSLGLVFRASINKYQIELDEDRFHSKLAQFGASFGLDDAARRKLLNNENLLLTIRSSVLEEQVIDALLQEVTYTEKPMEYDEVMNIASDVEEKNMDEVSA